jgi:structural maintenance of chromosome 3 (chondroitin sulfate proteoglycan 6)
MSREERQALLHEGSGSAVMSAYVEIIFDNSDGRFPTGKDELILRRTIGLKKDEYSLDRKNATRSDVMNLLESAGFSRSNPYYIVPQGRVTTLTNMKDAERLNLLKEVAGTQVYEARRAESLKIMNETTNKKDKIDELLDYIKERLSQLEEEMKELREYQDKDREKRCLEYAYYHREQVALSEALDEIEGNRQDGIESTDENRQAFMEGEATIAELEAEMSKLRRQMEKLRMERRQLEDDRKEAAKGQAKLELEVKALEEGQSSTEQAKKRHQQELKAVQDGIKTKESELATIVPEYNRIKGRETEVKSNLDKSEAIRQRLYSKQGRNAQYKTKAERDKWLRKEIDELNDTLATQKANRLDADEEVKAVQSEIQGLESDIEGLRERLAGWGDSRQALSDEVTSAKDALERLSDERKRLRREDDRLESNLENARHDRDRARRELSNAMDGQTAKGLETVRRLKQQHDLSGAYGTIAELLEVPEMYRTAVEQTAGNSLFHYIVDDEKTATFLVNALYEQRGGRVTFVPLSQLRQTRRPAFPQAKDAVPIIEKIRFDPAYSKAFEQVFGKTIVCPNLTIAGQYARSHGVNAITPDGDTTNKKGAMTGGYIDPRKSRLEAVRELHKRQGEFDTINNQAQDIRSAIEKKDQEITAQMGELRKAEQKLRQLDDSFDGVKADLRSKTSQLERLKDQLDAKKKRLDHVDNMMKQYSDQISAYQSELASDFKKALTNEEERQLEQLNTQVQDLRAQWNEIVKSRRELEDRKNLLEVDLRENLRFKLDQLNTQVVDSTTNGASGNVKEARRELQRLAKTSAQTESRLQENEHELEQTEDALSKREKEKAQTEQRQEEIARAIESFQKRMEKSNQRKAVLTEQAAECARNIRDLGVLPEEAFEKYQNTQSSTVSVCKHVSAGYDTDTSQLASKIKKVTAALQKYKHVNKKAFEQYSNFTNQRETLEKRRQELDASQKSIDELVEVLDQRKDEAIERTFKQVSREFARIFERLVPAGRGRLVIQRKTDAPAPGEEDDDQQTGRAVENYTGVGISVSFNSKHDEQQRIQQLSGGQKSQSSLFPPSDRLLTNLQQVCAPSLSSSQSNSAILRPSTSSTKSMPI